MKFLSTAHIVTPLRHIVITSVLFVVVDAIISATVDLSPSAPPPSTTSIFNRYPDGFYELKRELKTETAWSGEMYEVTTDRFGFRTLSSDSPSGASTAIFLGDSFTFGSNGPAREQFPWVYAELTGERVINAGVPSYSPTVYLFQYKRALAAKLLSTPHTVIIGLDPSDVQDEAAFWRDGPDHPILLNRLAATNSGEPTQGGPLHHLQLTKALFEIYRRAIANRLAAPQGVTERRRSAFTWDDWSKLNSTTAWDGGGYLPLGVQGGLDRLARKVREIADLARSVNGRVVLLIYPWPGMLTHPQKFSWEGYANSLCAEIGCALVNTIPLFKHEQERSPSWYTTLYANGDVHFSKVGNRMVAEALAQAAPSRTATAGANTTSPAS